MAGLTKIDPWFIQQMQEIVAVKQTGLASRNHRDGSRGLCCGKPSEWARATKQLARLWKNNASGGFATAGQKAHIAPVFKARRYLRPRNLKSFTPYMYSTYEDEDESETHLPNRKIVILGKRTQTGSGREIGIPITAAATQSFALPRRRITKP